MAGTTKMFPTGFDFKPQAPRKVVTATGITYLNSEPTLLRITPASYGITIYLPDATTVQAGTMVHIIDNRGAYPVRVCDSTGVLKAFVFAGVVSHISLDDNSTAAGVWAIENGELVGASAQLLTTSFQAVHQCIDLGSGKEILIANNSIATDYTWGVVYDRTTNTFGTPTTIRAAAVGSRFAACLSAANQVLVVSCTSTTAFEAVTLSISGTTITVNTAATATLSANMSAFADGCGLIAVGSSFVTSYKTVTVGENFQLRALSVSGTAVTIGTAEVLPNAGFRDALGAIFASGSVVVALTYQSGASTRLGGVPYTVSGATLTVGTSFIDALSAGITAAKATSLPNGRWALICNDRALICSLSGTVLTSTGVSTGIAGLVDAIVVDSNKVLMLSGATSSNANILTDTAGTASVGTAITLSSGTSRACLYVSGTDVYVGESSLLIKKVSCSAASPTLTSTQRCALSTIASLYTASNSVLSKSPTAIFGTSSAYKVPDNLTTSSNYLLNVVSGVMGLTKFLAVGAGQNPTPYNGKADSERWVTDAATSITKLECAL